MTTTVTSGTHGFLQGPIFPVPAQRGCMEIAFHLHRPNGGWQWTPASCSSSVVLRALGHELPRLLEVFVALRRLPIAFPIAVALLMLRWS